jgi:hypothetical protein
MLGRSVVTITFDGLLLIAELLILTCEILMWKWENKRGARKKWETFAEWREWLHGDYGIELGSVPPVIQMELPLDSNDSEPGNWVAETLGAIESIA